MNGRDRLNDLIQIAKVGRFRGTRGEVFIHPQMDLSGESLEGVAAVLQLPDETQVQTSINRIWFQGKKTIASFACSSDMDSARSLVHAIVFVPREQMEPLDEDEFFAEDLKGMVVLLSDGSELGVVTGLLSAGGQSQLQVQGKVEYLIPFVVEIVTDVDIAGGTITVNPPSGLLELHED